MKTTKHVTIGSRGSQLALWQAHHIKATLEQHFPGLEVRLEIIKTTGDAILDSPLSQIGDKGLFTKEIEHALLDGTIDLAVHSLKDVPTQLPAGLTIGAVSRREDVRDVFIAHPGKGYKSMDDIPAGGTIATGSLRRRAQLLHWRPDLAIVDLRGNLNTRFAKLEASSWDGMILARAGVVRLEMGDKITETISLERMLPAVGQGALGLELRADDAQTAKLLVPIHSDATARATESERALLRYLEGGCQIPLGAHARIEDNVLLLDAVIGSLDGRKIVRGAVRGEPGKAGELGERLAKTLTDSGGKAILDEIRGTAAGA
jgi:hydroxymethylbilane synthase